MERGIEKTVEKNWIPPKEPFLNILIVEDNPGDVIIVREFIKETGAKFNLTHATNLKETYAFCEQGEFDVILLDLGLQESTSLETLKKIKVFNIKSPIVVMTGLDDEDVALAALREGAQDYLVKNRLTSENILKSIKYAIERKKIQDLLKRHTHQFSILSSATASLSQCETKLSSFITTCENIHLLLEKANAISLEFEEPDSIRIFNAEWLTPWYDEIKIQTGIDLNNPVLPFTRQKQELVELFKDGKILEADGGLYDILKGAVDIKQCMELERITGTKKIYAFAFIKAEDFYGAGIILSPKIIDNDDLEIIETIVTQATLCIHRRSIEKDLRLSEFRLTKLSKELEDKVIVRTKDLETANENLHLELTERIKAEDALKKSELQLTELNTTKDKFFSIVAHDLKNPFTSLIGTSELLYDNISNLKNDDIHKLALVLNDSAKSGYAILQNLLDWSRSQTGLLKYNPENLSLDKLIEENISNLHLFASNKEINMIYKPNGETSIFSDKGMIDTILRNILSNAIKFSHRGSKVLIHTKYARNEVVISVKDSGIGISAENIEKIFKLDTKHSGIGTEKEQGTGLGLKLSKELVEKGGGSIWVESIVNQGSTFNFSIPLKKSKPK